jgi:hypothetical protein
MSPMPFPDAQRPEARHAAKQLFGQSRDLIAEPGCLAKARRKPLLAPSAEWR